LKTRNADLIVSPASKLKLLEYSWPGNVRELFNVMERSMLMAKNENVLDDVIIDAGEKPGAPVLGERLADTVPNTWADFKRFKSGDLKLRKEELERIFVQKLLIEHNGNVSVSARHAGIDRRQFQDLIKSLGIDASLFRGREIER
jgi:DNA-binding NtrC family response regulator